LTGTVGLHVPSAAWPADLDLLARSMLVLRHRSLQVLPITRAVLAEVLMHGLDGLRPIPDGPGHAVHRTLPHVAAREHAGHGCLEG
jgi:hypothetical protein